MNSGAHESAVSAAAASWLEELAVVVVVVVVVCVWKGGRLTDHTRGIDTDKGTLTPGDRRRRRRRKRQRGTLLSCSFFFH